VTKTDVALAAYGRVVEFYNKFLLDVNGDTVKDPVTGEPTLVGDSAVVSDVAVNAYKGTDDTTVTAVRVIIDSVADGTAPVAGYAVVVSLEDAPATLPGPAQFLWKRTGLSQAAVAPAGTCGGGFAARLRVPRWRLRVRRRARGRDLRGLQGDRPPAGGVLLPRIPGGGER